MTIWGPMPWPLQAHSWCWHQGMLLHYILSLKLRFLVYSTKSRGWTLLVSCSFWELFWLFLSCNNFVDIMPGFHTICMIILNKCYSHFLPSLWCLCSCCNCLKWCMISSIYFFNLHHFKQYYFIIELPRQSNILRDRTVMN